jgi:hypothetical protein
MRDTFLRLLTVDEMNYLHIMLEDTTEVDRYRAKIILLKDAGFTVPEIRRERLIIMIATSENGYIASMKRV